MAERIWYGALVIGAIVNLAFLLENPCNWVNAIALGVALAVLVVQILFK